MLALVVGLPGPGQAARWSGPDPTGDATTFGFSPDPPPCGTLVEGRSSVGDIRRLSVRHAGEEVGLTLDVAGLRRLDDVYLSLLLRTERRGYEVDVDLRPGRPTRASLTTAMRYGPLAEPDECGNQYVGGSAQGIACRLGAHLDRGAGRVTVTVPRSCLRTPRWVRAGAEVQGDLGEGVVVLDRWERPDRADDDPLTPAYGVRVRWSPR